MELLVSVLVLGATNALLAAGIVIVYKASRIVNFATANWRLWAPTSSIRPC